MSSSKTIGIIGSGQLGQMMAISAMPMETQGHRAGSCGSWPASCSNHRGAHNDVNRQLAEQCDILTYEFENVDADGLDAVIRKVSSPQGTDLLRISKTGF